MILHSNLSRGYCQVTVWLMLSLVGFVMQHTPAIFIAGDPALDFLNSVATPVDVPVEWLDDGDGLLSWLRQAQLVPAPVLPTSWTRWPTRHGICASGFVASWRKNGDVL